MHQVGRAGSLETNGFSMTFINNSSKKLFLEMKELFELTENKLPQELLQSPYISIWKEKREKLSKQGKLKRKQWTNDDVNPQNLLEILTKARRR